MFAFANLADWTNVNPPQPVSHSEPNLAPVQAAAVRILLEVFGCDGGSLELYQHSLYISPNLLVIRKHLGQICAVVFGRTWSSHMKRIKASAINVTTSACQRAIISDVWREISSWIQTRLSAVFMLRASWCCDSKTSFCWPQVLDGCAASHRPDQSPRGGWATGPFWARLPSSCLFLLFIYFLHLASQELFLLRQLEIPLSVERHPSLALSGNFRRTCDPAQNGNDKHLNLSSTEK